MAAKMILVQDDAFVPYPKRRDIRLERALLPRSFSFWQWRWHLSEVLDELCSLVAFQTHLCRWWWVQTEFLEFLDHREEHDYNVRTAYQRIDGKSPVSLASNVPLYKPSYSARMEVRRSLRFAKRNPFPFNRLMSDERIQWLLTYPGVGDYILSFLDPDWWTTCKFLVEPRSYGVSHCLPDWFAVRVHKAQTKWTIDDWCNCSWYHRVQFNTALDICNKAMATIPSCTTDDLRLLGVTKGEFYHGNLLSPAWYIALYLVNKFGADPVPEAYQTAEMRSRHLYWEHHSVTEFPPGSWQLKSGWACDYTPLREMKRRAFHLYTLQELPVLCVFSDR